ncbi:MAG: hypothetical protein OXB88_02050 [Bacteriovoracales bacterium]|nr:hypothetical protein [Bacteriovoracales bacterium]
MRNVIHFLSLFGSLGTLLCCALPVLFVSLGMGAVFASLTATIPQISWVVEHKTILFIITGVLLTISYAFMRHSRNLPCPIHGPAREACQKTRPMTKWIFYSSIAVYGVGIFFSYILPKILYG